MDTLLKLFEFFKKHAKDPDLPIFILMILIKPTINILTVGVGTWYVLRKILTDFQSEKDALSKQISEKEKEDTVFDKIRQIVKEELADSESRSNVRFNRVDERFDRVDERFDRVDERFERVENDIKEIKTDIKVVRSDVDQIKGKVEIFTRLIPK